MIILAVCSYLFGNINFAKIISKSKKDDITKYGSGNPGTLNTWRAFGFWAGLITFLLDMAKGVVACLLGYFILPTDLIPDMIAVLGFTDDATALIWALKTVKKNITPEIEEQAKQKCESLLLNK